MQQIMVDADLGRSRDGYTREEEEFRDRIEGEIVAARARGQGLGFTSELPGATWTYWRRMIGPRPLRVGAVYRRSDAGEFQTWTEGQWVTVPGESIGRLTTEGDPMLEPSPHDASCPDPMAPAHSALSCDVPDFRPVEA